ncbi:MAG: SdrD B-like domain-containing protein, partial [Thermoflexales bacterium]
NINNDNGVNTVGNQTTSNLIVLTPASEPTVNNATGSTANPPLPPATPPVTDKNPSHYETIGLALGNLVWYDTNNDGVRDGSETGTANVAVQLYRDTNGDGIYSPGVDGFAAAVATDANGNYTFTQLIAGGYLVVIASSNFAPGGALRGYQNSADLSTLSLGNSGVNNVDHGVSVTLGITVANGYVASTVVTLTVGGKPVIDDDIGLPNANTNTTLDFGFYRLEVGNQVFYDTTTTVC